MNKKIIENKEAKNNKTLVWLVILSVLGIGLFFGGGLGYFYMSTSISPSLKIIYQKIPLPIAKINEEYTITSKQLFQDTEAVKKFYESKDYTQKGERVDFSTEEGKIRLQIKEKDVLNKLIEDAIVKTVAKSKGIKISSQEINQAVEKSLMVADSDYSKLALNLNSNYGWTVEQFKNKIVKNQLYLEKLFKWYKKNLQNSDKYHSIRQAKNKITKNGDNFSEVVREFSEGESVQQEGKIPWIDEKNIVPEISEVLGSMKDGEISDIIISPLGMHIIMLEKRREIKDSNGVVKREVQLRHLFVRGKSFVDWIQEQKKQMKVEIFLREYSWNNTEGEINFANGQFKKTAQRVKVRSQGDPSLR